MIGSDTPPGIKESILGQAASISLRALESLNDPVDVLTAFVESVKPDDEFIIKL